MNLHQRLDIEAAPLWALPRAEARDRLIEHYRPFAEMLADWRSNRNALFAVDADHDAETFGRRLSVSDELAGMLMRWTVGELQGTPCPT